MRSLVALPRALLAGLFALLIGGCASETSFEYPEFEQWDAFAAPRDCAGVELELRRVDAVRWSMREDGIRIGGEPLAKAGKIGLFALVAGASIAAGVAPTGFPYDIREERGREHTLEQADRRLVRLLQRKRELGCPPAPTARSGVSDMDLLAEVEALNRRRKAGEIPDWREVELRSQAMDELHASGFRRREP